jgi:hypothetical protein
MKIVLSGLTVVFMMLATAPVFAVTQQQGQSNNSGNTSGSSSSSQGDPNGSSTQTKTQTQTLNQGEDSQLKISQSVQTALNESKASYAPSNSNFKKNLDDTVAASGKLISLSAQVATQNEGLATQIQQIAKEQVKSTEQAAQALDKANNKNAALKFLFGTDFGQVNNAKEQMEQNRNRIQILNQVKAQVQNTSLQSDLQAQITVLEAQNASLQQNIDKVVGGFSLLGWLFNWLN